MSAPSPHALLIRQIETVSPLDDNDRRILKALPLRMRTIEENRDIIREGQEATECCLIIKGVLCRYKIVAGGRQILSFHFAGDMPDLQSALLLKSDHSLSTLTSGVVAYIAHDSLRAASRESATVAFAFHRQSLIDGAIFREWIANIGRRLAIERVAHIICECYERMRALGLVQDHSFVLPITQAELADATGLSTVHINRTMQLLRQAGLVKTHGKTVTIEDWKGLREQADFNPAYLHLLPNLAA